MVLGAAAYRAIRRACGILFPMIPIAAIARAAEPISGRASVIDGDTIEIHSVRIRLPGIDAPEARPTCRVKGKTWRGGVGRGVEDFCVSEHCQPYVALGGQWSLSREPAGRRGISLLCVAWHDTSGFSSCVRSPSRGNGCPGREFVRHPDRRHGDQGGHGVIDGRFRNGSLLCHRMRRRQREQLRAVLHGLDTRTSALGAAKCGHRDHGPALTDRSASARAVLPSRTASSPLHPRHLTPIWPLNAAA